MRYPALAAICAILLCGLESRALSQSRIVTPTDEMPISEKVSLLQEASADCKRNFDRIRTWKGIYEYTSEAIFEGEYADAILANVKSTDGSFRPPLLRRTAGTCEFAVDRELKSVFCHNRSEGSPKLFEVTSSRQIPEVTSSRRPYPRLLAYDTYAVATPEMAMEFAPNFRLGSNSKVPILTPGAGFEGSANIFSQPRQLRDGPIWPLDANAWIGDIFDPCTLFGYDRAPWEYWKMYVDNLKSRDPVVAAYANAKIRTGREATSHGDCIVVTGEQPTSLKRTVLCRSVAYNLIEEVRFRKVAAQGTMLPQHEIKWEYKAINGVYLPERVRERTFGDDGISVRSERSYRIRNVELNTPINANQFSIRAFPAPDGTQAINRVGNTLKYVRSGELVSKEEFTRE
jgi:hypothetical protein